MTGVESGEPGAGSDRGPAVIAVVFTALVLAVGVGWWNWPEKTPPVQLDVDFSGAVPEVREAIETARDRVRLAPESGEAWGELAMLLRAHGYDRPADESFRRAQRLDANEFRWPYLLGVSLENVDPVEAERCLRRALAVAPDLALPRLPLAELLVAAGRSEEAATLFGEANELEPLNTRAMLGLARLESDAGRLAEAESLCRQAEEIAPQNRMVQELLARVLFRQGRREEAERLRRRLETMPQVETSDDPFVAEVLILRRDPNWIAVKAQTMLDQGLTQRAVEYLETVIANHPGRIRFPLQLARALGGAGRPAQARKVLERAVTEFPESAELRLVLGLVLGEMEELAEAAESFDAAIQRKPDYAEAWVWRGRTLRDRMKIEEAERCFRQAIRFRPALPDGYAELGALLLAAGRVGEAVDALETAVDLSPGTVSWRRRLSEARRRLDR
jgi:tetratricopeptide (TPR) repeat protein